jgi:hypothetical protein
LFLGCKTIFGALVLSDKRSWVVNNKAKLDNKFECACGFGIDVQDGLSLPKINDAPQRPLLFISLIFMIFLSAVANILALAVSLPVLLYCGSLLYISCRCFFQEQDISQLSVLSGDLFEKSANLDKAVNERLSVSNFNNSDSCPAVLSIKN